MSINKLSAYIDRELPDNEIIVVEEHLRSCPACRKALKLIEAIDEKAASPLYDDPGEAYWDRVPEAILDKIGLTTKPAPKTSSPMLWKMRNFVLTLWQPKRLAFRLVGAAAILVLLFIVSTDVYKQFSTPDVPVPVLREMKQFVISEKAAKSLPRAPEQIMEEPAATVPDVEIEALPEDFDEIKEEDLLSSDNGTLTDDLRSMEVPDDLLVVRAPQPKKLKPSPTKEAPPIVRFKRPEPKAAMDITVEGAEPMSDLHTDKAEAIVREEDASRQHEKELAETADIQGTLAVEEATHPETQKIDTSPVQPKDKQSQEQSLQSIFGALKKRDKRSESMNKSSRKLAGGGTLQQMQSQFSASAQSDAFDAASRDAAKAKTFSQKETVWLDFLKQHPGSPNTARAKSELAMIYYEHAGQSVEILHKGIAYFKKERNDLVIGLGEERYEELLLDLLKRNEK
ncbi:zf-HC2 domain-containing protein [candidate division KSB1 bacterium]|nr:zf-HC2 domain-containing protein [candidate division KSB1 bacterium]